ncbi:MAG: VCBS repeat-containing protein [Ignavibacteria bacterium]|nr:VCBS repeat-containing protein [Ignavibacteria bacterium]
MDNGADVSLTADYLNNSFGYSISGAGDVNGDGFDDVIVGSSASIISYINRAYIFYGGAAMDNIADVNFTGANYSSFGASVSGAGDLNGDGYDDVIISSSSLYTFTYNSYIFFGGSSMNNIADVTLSGLAESVSGAGDVNGDGYDDVIVGAYLYGIDTSRAFIYFGGIDMDNTFDIEMNEKNSNDYFGASVSGAGDINGDGYSDVIVGAEGYSNHTGRAYIYLSSPPDNRKNLFLFGAIQGLYDPVLNTEVPDTIKVYLRNSTSPFARVDSSKNILLGPGTGQYFLFRNAQNSKPYYIEVTHRNALSTWSADPVTFVNSDASIAFSVNSFYAYGDNEVQVDASPYNVFAFYSGDVNQNGAIDLTDVLAIYNGANNFLTGYVVTDLNGNDVVDLADVLMAYNNSVGFVSVVKP